MNYIRIYASIINRARQREHNRHGHHRHHIVPVCMGGGDQEENLVSVTLKEHYILHLLLARINPDIHGLRASAYALARNSRSQKFCPFSYSSVEKIPKQRERWSYAKLVGQMPLEDRRMASRLFASLACLDAGSNSATA